MAYATEAEMLARFGFDQIVRVTDDTGAYVAINSARLQTRLDDAAAEIDSYLAGRVALPLTPVPQILVRLACDIAWYHLLGDRGGEIEAARARYTDAVAFLRRVASGEVSLGDETPGTAAEPTAGTPLVATPGRTFDRDSLAGF